MITEKDKNHKTGSEEVENGGMIPFLQLGEFNNPGNINFQNHTFTYIKFKYLIELDTTVCPRTLCTFYTVA